MDRGEQKAGILFVVSHGPHSGSLAQDFLDAVMTAALLNQAVALLFVADGIFQLTSPGPAGKIGSLSGIGPVELFASGSDLQQRRLSAEALLQPAQILDGKAARALLSTYSHVLSF